MASLTWPKARLKSIGIAGFSPYPYDSRMDQTAQDEPPSGEELAQARDRLMQQLEILKYPMQPRDLNPVLIAKLQAMLDEINARLSDLETNVA